MTLLICLSLDITFNLTGLKAYANDNNYKKKSRRY